jgi:LPXTG-motif cell wall-anchored protein
MAPAAEPAPAAAAAEPAPAAEPMHEHKKLPKTASTLPLLALVGFLSAGAGLALRRSR